MSRLLEDLLMANTKSEVPPDLGNNSTNVLLCKPGIVLPVWEPLEDVPLGDIIGRGVVYILSLAYLFVGVGFLTHKFMDSIMMITSKRKEVKVRNVDGAAETVIVRIWNPTVAAITLMALGCSMPEVLLTGLFFFLIFN